MDRARVTLAPGIESLHSLGASGPEAILGREVMDDQERLEAISAGPAWTLVRIPLPGTPRSDGGPLSGTPRGVGTGWIRILRFEGGRRRDLLAARLRAPRSASLAERRWNLLCLLRSAGVATPEPLAVVGESSFLTGGRSALVWREPDGGRPLLQDLQQRTGSGRRRVLEALGRFVAQLADSGVLIRDLDPEHLWVQGQGGTKPESANDACGLEQVLAARSDGAVPVAGMAWRELPQILHVMPLDARLGRRPVREFLTSLADAGIPPSLSRADRMRVLRAAFPASPAAAWRAVARS